MKRFLMGFIIGFVILGIGIPITAIEFLGYDYSEKEYFDNVEYKEQSYVYNIDNKNINVYGIYGDRLYKKDFVNIIEDNSMNDEIKLVIRYPHELTDINVVSDVSNSEMNLYINYEDRHNIEFNAVRKIIINVIEDLKDNTIYSYNKTIEPKITVYVSSNNVNKIDM